MMFVRTLCPQCQRIVKAVWTNRGDLILRAHNEGTKRCPSSWRKVERKGEK